MESTYNNLLSLKIVTYGRSIDRPEDEDKFQSQMQKQSLLIQVLNEKVLLFHILLLLVSNCKTRRVRKEKEV